MSGKTNTEIIWAPQPGPQKALIDCPISEIFYGGARGGGKTDGILGKYSIKGDRYGAAFNAVFFRREMPQQDDLIERAKEIYLPLDAEWHEQKKMFVFAGGGRVRFRPLENISDAEKYQGQNLSDAAVEEAGNYPDPRAIEKLFGALRSAAGVPTQLILTANPGGPGHHWIKDRYIDPAPMGMRILQRELGNGKMHRYVYIPSRVQHNQILLRADPEYVDRLHLVGSPELVRAWLEGDWSVISGAFFPEFSLERHVVRPFQVPQQWTRFRAMDWGSARPFSVGWYAIGDGSVAGVPKGCLVKYREWYGASSPNVGIRLTAEEVAAGILEREKEDDVSYGVLDPAAWKVDGGPSIAERMYVSTPSGNKVLFRKADNSRLTGWDQLRARLKGDEGGPQIVFFSTCQHTIRTLPALQHDEAKAEDVDTEGEDHAGDETRYACMSRPYQRPTRQPPPKGKTLQTMSLDDLWAATRPGRARI
jgi:hypothetical protein